MSNNLTVEVFNGDVAGALKRFKMLGLKTGLFKEQRRHDFYTPPGERRRRKSKVARAKLAKAARRQAEYKAEWLKSRGMTDD